MTLSDWMGVCLDACICVRVSISVCVRERVTVCVCVLVWACVRTSIVLAGVGEADVVVGEPVCLVLPFPEAHGPHISHHESG
jgi:hypothetical protein